MDESTNLYMVEGRSGSDAVLFPSTTTNIPIENIVTTPTPAEVDFANCSLPSPFHAGGYNGITGAICVLCLFFGIFCALFGYRCFKAIMFLTGFIFGSVIVYLICLEEAILPMWSNTLIALSAGLLFGLITLLVQYVGLFMLGFHGGLLLGVVGLVVVDICREAVHVSPTLPQHSPWISVGVLLSSGLVVSLLNLYFQKYLTLFCSALYGGAVVASSLDYFVEDSVMLTWVWDKVRVRRDHESLQGPCWFSWAILGSWPAIFMLGVVTQWLVTGDGTYHDEQFTRTKRRTNPETREERKQRKYRFLYQVRTCHGDVISQPISKKYVHQIDESCS